MRRLALAGLMAVLSSGLAFAKIHDDKERDREDTSPIQVGYAIVTPTSAGGGLTVFETFAFKRFGTTSEVGLLPSDMTTEAMIFVRTSGRLARNMGVAIANPAGTPTSVAITLRNSDGTIVAAKNITLVAFQQTARFVTELFADHAQVPRDFTGTITMISTNPVAMAGLRFRGANFSTIPVTNLSAPTAVPLVSPGVGGPRAIILPHFATGGGWGSEIVIVNTDINSSITVRVDLFKQDGTPLTAELNGQSRSSFSGLVIPKGGVLVLSRLGDGDDDD
jgi:hypothetical protein